MLSANNQGCPERKVFSAAAVTRSRKRGVSLVSSIRSSIAGYLGTVRWVSGPYLAPCRLMLPKIGRSPRVGSATEFVRLAVGIIQKLIGCVVIAEALGLSIPFQK